MNRRIPYVPNELKIIGELPGFFAPPQPLRDYPVSARENVAAMYFDKHPYWLPLPADSAMMIPNLYNELLGRGGPAGTVDAFGIEWEWVESAGGSIVHPGEPFLADANEWKDKIKIPDIDAWDWAAEAEKTKLDQRVSNQVSFVNGFWFERLISFMDFAPAAMALLDDDQIPAVHELFAAMTELGCKLVDKFCEYWPALDGFNIHDD
ncbi:MAG: methyltransferase, partial [Oscillospiraceae bacterium]|nr:methyltransferase [Oscillospiraceae bacterium]